jgi:hypothetical protein
VASLDQRSVTAQPGIVYVKITDEPIPEQALDQRFQPITVNDIRIEHHSIAIECTYR